MPLSLVATGETVRLLQIQSDSRLRKRLADLGLNSGMTVRVIQNNFRGPLILAVQQDARLAIARSMAHQIHVTEATA